MIKKYVTAIVVVCAVAASKTALAYVGPGAGLSLLGALWGLLVAIVVALGFIILWPIRRMRRQRAMARSASEGKSKRSRENRPIEDEAGRETS